jgi:hypothetical protein
MHNTSAGCSLRPIISSGGGRSFACSAQAENKKRNVAGVSLSSACQTLIAVDGLLLQPVECRTPFETAPLFNGLFSENVYVLFGAARADEASLLSTRGSAKFSLS